MAQSLANIAIHLVFSTKNRQAFIKQGLQPELNRYFAGILKNLECPAIEIGSCEDHVHILFNLSRVLPLSKVVEKLKTSSSKWIKTQSPLLESFAWQNGYGAFSVSQSNVENVRDYIANQRRHHQKMTFKEELIKFLEKHDLAYDENYLWE